MNRVIDEVKSKISITHQEGVELGQFLEGIERELNRLNLEMSFNKWVALSIHLVNLIRRVKEKETIPTIEPSLWEQLSQQIVESSRSLLEPIKEQVEDSHYSSEVFLLAVHLEGASHLQGGK